MCSQGHPLPHPLVSQPLGREEMGVGRDHPGLLYLGGGVSLVWGVVTPAPKHRPVTTRHIPGSMPSAPEDQWPHVSTVASTGGVYQIDCLGGVLGPQTGEGLWREGPRREPGVAGSIKRECVALGLSFPIRKTRGLGQVAQTPFQVKAVRSAASVSGGSKRTQGVAGLGSQGRGGRGLAALRSPC